MTDVLTPKQAGARLQVSAVGCAQALVDAASAAFHRIADYRGRIYFIQAVTGGPIKVGFSKRPSARLFALQAGSPVSLCLLATMFGDLELERDIHRALHGARIGREWFLPVRELVDIAAGLPGSTRSHPARLLGLRVVPRGRRP
ncbi:MAG: GIY-YIG nuclease family protein [Polyangiaceae bacterium]